MKEVLAQILKHAAGVRQGIGHIRNGANVTSDELWSANESLDELFKVAVKAKEEIEQKANAQELRQSNAKKFTTGHCKHNNQPGGCKLHNLQCGYPACDRKAV